MKVVYVTFSGRSGMAHYAENLAVAMASEASARAVFIAPRSDLALLGGDAPVVPVERSDKSWKRRMLELYNPRFYRRIARRIVRDYTPDIVHVTSDSTGLLAFVKAIRRLGVVAVCTIHDPIRHDEVRTRWGRFYEWYQAKWQVPAVVRACNAVHVHSALHQADLGNLYGPDAADKAYVVLHGGGLTKAIAAGDHRPAELKGLFQGRPTLLFFGRIEPYKGLDVLLRALDLLVARGVAVNLVIAGSGTSIGHRLPAGAEVILIQRFIKDAEIRSLFEAASLVVLPYLSATQSGVIPMAYAFAKPVISTTVGSLHEVVKDGETGFLVPPGDPAALAGVIERAVQGPDNLVRMGRKAKLFLEESLSWSEVARQHLKVYRRLLE
ncbi:MAG: glycosyl transferase family 1 [Gammaproteobacteria bacterium]|nr:MAG: glycosyltransferase [Pseudomonadota bacterium]GIK34465.1 MAG: glycosyl transferase family 1 [Gammaproteobacteria bacterium]